jgi:diguanylate cyclase (GGDEF)-like protein
LDTPKPPPPKPDAGDLLRAVLEGYRSALRGIGKSGDRVCAALGAELQQGLAEMESSLAGKISPAALKETEIRVEAQLQQWGDRAAEYFKAKANDVKELLIVLARTSESLGERDQRYATRFTQFRQRLEMVANLEDLTHVRASLVQQAGEMKACVDQMAQESKKSVAALQAEVSTYETRLKAVEELASRDALTGLANRRSVEERMEFRAAKQQPFCVALLDLNGFKQVNDHYGHGAGDELLKQFAEELRSNVRTVDAIGRWGGDEFILVFDSDLAGAQPQIERMQKWVFGEYTLPDSGAGKVTIKMDASIGLAQWAPGETVQNVTEHADAAMYREKKQGRKSSAASA